MNPIIQMLSNKGKPEIMNPIIQMLSNSEKFSSYIKDLENKKSPSSLTRAY